MSIGNLRDSGNLGNNFQSQYKVLEGLQGIIDAIVAGSGGGEVTIINPIGQTTMNNSLPVTIASDQVGGARLPGFFRANDSSLIALTTYSLSVSNVGSADGQFLGNILKPGETLNFNADGVNNYYAPNTFSYNAVGTEFIIIFNI